MGYDGDWLERLTREKVLNELDAFVRSGRRTYLEERGLKRRGARTYFILHQGEYCDMKAIAYAAGGFPEWNPKSHEVAERLEELDFKLT